MHTFILSFGIVYFQWPLPKIRQKSKSGQQKSKKEDNYNRYV